MKEVFLLTCLLLAFSPFGMAQTQQLPTQRQLEQNQRDTPIQIRATITSYSDSSTKAILNDTAYLHNLSGTYQLIDGSNQVVTIRVTQTKTLRIALPGQGEHELVPIVPIQFHVKDIPQIEILIFLDSSGRPRSLNVIDKREWQASKRQLMANKLGTFTD